MKVLVIGLFFAVISSGIHVSGAQTKSDADAYSRRNTFTVFGEYSNDSSRIIMGSTVNRKLAGIGGQYERRLLTNRYLRWSYMAEFRPFILSSDPASTYTGTSCIGGVCNTYEGYTTVTPRCVAGSASYSIVNGSGAPIGTDTVVTTCSRQSTLAQGGSPIGFRINPFPRHPLQVTLSSNGGYMFSTKPIPIPQAGNFNFTFNFGGGLEYFYKLNRSIRLEYLVQHYSNHSTAPANPGVDSGFIRLAYAFKR